MPRLVNEELSDLMEKITSYEENLSTAVYEQFKSSVMLAQTNNLRGNTGDVFKEYMGTVHMQLAEKIINIISEIKTAVNQMQNDFTDFEKSDSGIVGSGTLDNVKQSIQQSNGEFTDLDGESSNLLDRAAEFISTTNLQGSNVEASYSEVTKEVTKTRTGLDESDEKVVNDLRAIEERVQELQEQISDLSGKFHDKNGIIYSKVSDIQNEDWYTNESTGSFAEKLEDDPFIHTTGNASVAAGQLVAGVDDQTYATSSGSVLSASGHYTQDDNHIDTQGGFSVLDGSFEAQATDYLSASGSGGMLGAEGHLTIDDKGLDASGEVYVLQAEGSGMIGTDNFNGHVNGSADVLTADGTLVAQVDEDNGDFEFGLGGNASAATLKGDVGITLFGVETSGKIGDGDEEVSLFGLNAEGSIGFQAGAGVELLSQTVYSPEYFDVKANRVKVDLALLGGIKIDFQFPSISLKWPF